MCTAPGIAPCVVLVGLADVEHERAAGDALGGAGGVDLGDLGLGGRRADLGT